MRDLPAPGMLAAMGDGLTEGEGPTPSPRTDALARTLPGERSASTRPSEADDGDTVQLSHERIGRYRVVAPLGSGGMGLVHLAHDDDLDRAIAIKVLRPGAGGEPRRLLREARSMARLSHPHIAAVYDVGTHEGDVYLAMEYVAGPTLRAWMETDTADAWAPRCRALLEAARGLAAAHRQGVVHRDFKPENVIVGDDGRVRVLDFGLARLAPRTASATAESLETQVGIIVGTPRYMAPEQLRGQKAGPAADQFAFCVTAYEVAYRSLPFDGEVFADVAASVLTRPPRDPSDTNGVPPGLWPLLRRGMAVDPDERHPDMDALVEAIESLTDAPGSGAVVVSRPALRDAQEDARRRLTDAYAGDLLDADELDERLEQLESAANLPAVATLIADLAPLPPAAPMPAARSEPEPATLAVPEPAVPAVVDLPARGNVIAVFSGSRRGGVWTPARVNRVFAMFGGTTIDLREAILPPAPAVVEVHVFAMFGGATIIVAPGTRVLMECTAVMGGAEQDDASIAPNPDGPIVRITGFVMFGGVGVIERLPGESNRAARKRRRALQKAKRAKALPPKR